MILPQLGHAGAADCAARASRGQASMTFTSCRAWGARRRLKRTVCPQGDRHGAEACRRLRGIRQFLQRARALPAPGGKKTWLRRACRCVLHAKSADPGGRRFVRRKPDCSAIPSLWGVRAMRMRPRPGGSIRLPLHADNRFKYGVHSGDALGVGLEAALGGDHLHKLAAHVHVGLFYIVGVG